MNLKILEAAEALHKECLAIPTCTICPLLRTLCYSEGIREGFPQDWEYELGHARDKALQGGLV